MTAGRLGGKEARRLEAGKTGNWNARKLRD
jgi:hypothetical protein